MNNVMKMTVPGKPEFLNLCSDAAVTFAAVSGMDVDAVEDFAMAVYEACKILTCHESDCWCGCMTNKPWALQKSGLEKRHQLLQTFQQAST